MGQGGDYTHLEEWQPACSAPLPWRPHWLRYCIDARHAAPAPSQPASHLESQRDVLNLLLSNTSPVLPVAGPALPLWASISCCGTPANDRQPPLHTAHTPAPSEAALRWSRLPSGPIAFGAAATLLGALAGTWPRWWRGVPAIQMKYCLLDADGKLSSADMQSANRPCRHQHCS